MKKNLQDEIINEFANEFIKWKLPDSVCADGCASMRGYLHRSGTNLLTFDEAKQLAEEIVVPIIAKYNTPSQDAEPSRDSVVQKQIDEIMDWFPFEKVQEQMKHEKWTWNSESESPEIPELRKAARERLLSAARIEPDGTVCGYSSSGGFSARCVEGVEDGKKWLRLSLMFGHEWDCEGEFYE